MQRLLPRSAVMPSVLDGSVTSTFTLLQQHVNNTEEPYCKACEVD